MNLNQFMSRVGSFAQAIPLSLTVAVLAVAPIVPAIAQTPSSPTVQMERGWAKLNLTDDQKAQLKTIKESTRAAIDQVLTDDQKQQLQQMKAQAQTLRQQGQKPQKGMFSLKLTDDQKAKIQEIHRSARKQMEAVLTPDQLKQLHQGGRHHHQGQPQQNQPSS